MEVVKELDFGIYFREGDVEILMPTKWVPQGTKIGDTLNVFVFRDSDDRLIATTVKPFATADTFAFLEAKQVNEIGAFMDWGMDKDLLVPFREQAQRMEAGKSYVVFVYVDEPTDRLVGSTKLSRFILLSSILRFSILHHPLIHNRFFVNSNLSFHLHEHVLQNLAFYHQYE